jgi:hypothetical protein
MYRKLIYITAFTAIAGVAFAQPRRAAITGRGNPGEGKCTIEVVVDGAAEVEIRGESATLRNLQGGPPQWRRFECNAPMPPNPADFRFSGVDGRGRQTLVRDPRNGGPAVVRIEDPDNGSEGYTFDITWRGAGYAGGPPPIVRPDYRREGDGRDQDGYYSERERRFRGNDWRARFFERVRDDLDHIQAGPFARGADQYRLARTRQELDELQGKWSAGRYDERQLDSVIGALQRVVNDNRLSRRDRDILSDDLDRLRDFRANHERWRGR